MRICLHPGRESAPRAEKSRHHIVCASCQVVNSDDPEVLREDYMSKRVVSCVLCIMAVMVVSVVWWKTQHRNLAQTLHASPQPAPPW